MAVTKVDDKIVMTVEEMKKKYPTKWFRYAMVSEPDFFESKNNSGYVIFIGDTDVELYDLRQHGYSGECLAFGKGDHTSSVPEVGSIYYHD